MAENTSFSNVYDRFLSKVTDDMYMEMFPEDVNAILQDLMLDAMQWFEFPRVDIFDYDLDTESFNIMLSSEEINIISTYMVAEWMGQQLANVELVRQKYAGADFKMTSQAAHMDKLRALKMTYEKAGLHLQRLYKRRTKNDQGQIVSTFGSMMEVF